MPTLIGLVGMDPGPDARSKRPKKCPNPAFEAAGTFRVLHSGGIRPRQSHQLLEIQVHLSIRAPDNAL
jgi:hypothetical protein